LRSRMHKRRTGQAISFGGRRFGICLIAGLQIQSIHAYGPAGHLIAGEVAESMLCRQAAAMVRDLGAGETLGEIGLWADRIRSDAAYADSGPWHYINIADGTAVEDAPASSEGDVIRSIERFAATLTDISVRRTERAEALKFLVHFIVDLHQPLHVGRAEDRGGNSIALRFRGETTNLHRFWDTHAIEASGLSISAYVRELEHELDDYEFSAGLSLDPLVWAEESMALREEIYEFGESGREPPPAYVGFAAETTRQRLKLAGLRLAGTLNGISCQAADSVRP